MAAKINELKRDAAEPSSPAAAQAAKPGLVRRLSGPLLVLLLVALGGVAAYGYWLYSARHPSTDNAYIQANVVQITALATGPITEVDVKEFARVKSGDVLLKIDRAAVRAPVDGIVGKFALSVGEVAKAGVPLFPLVDTSKWWVESNFKETDLSRIEPGQKATVVVDLYPGHDFTGTVEAVSPASLAAFSLLPPENSTSNWVKVTQRFPVRIALKLDPNDPELRVGASATVTVDTAKDAASGGK